MAIRTKLLLALAVGMALILGIGGLTLAGMSQIADVSAELSDDTVASLITVDQINAAIAEYRVLQSAHIGTQDEASAVSVEERMLAAEQRMTDLLTEYAPYVSNQDEREAYDRIRTLWPAFVDNTRKILLPASRAKIYQRSFAAYNGLNDDYTLLTAASADLVSISRAQSRDALARTRAVLNQNRIAIIIATIAALALLAGGWLAISTPLRRTIGRLMDATAAIAAGDLEHRIDMPGRDELAQLGQAFGKMQAALRSARASEAAKQGAIEARSRELEQAIADLHTANASREQLTETIRALASPVLPVMRGVLVMPLIGVIDGARAANLTETLLHEIERTGTRAAIIDVTGVPLVDTEVAAALISVAGAARLIGAETILVGIRPELAQTIVGLGIDLGHFVTRNDLESGIRYAAQRYR
jgi:anti-anti-sigma regulatory factor/HAMP domain-containing protein